MIINGITLVDGGVGTSLWEKVESKKPVWTFNVTNPDKVLELHEEMAAAGAEYVLANTFAANRPSCEKEGYTSEEIIRPAMELAHQALDKTESKITLGVGPLTGLLEPFGNISEADCADYYREQISLGVAGKPNVIWLQTFMDLKMLEIAVQEAGKFDLPVFATMSFSKYNERKRSRTIMGNGVDDVLETLGKYDFVKAVGVNCSMEPEKAIDFISEFSEKSDMPLIFKPNAGNPLYKGGAEVDHKQFAADVAKAADLPNVKYLGGCCGANAKYIEALRDELLSR